VHEERLLAGKEVRIAVNDPEGIAARRVLLTWRDTVRPGEETEEASLSSFTAWSRSSLVREKGGISE